MQCTCKHILLRTQLRHPKVVLNKKKKNIAMECDPSAHVLVGKAIQTGVLHQSNIHISKKFTEINGAIARLPGPPFTARKSRALGEASRSCCTAGNPVSPGHNVFLYTLASQGAAGHGCLELESGARAFRDCGLFRPVSVGGLCRYQSLLESNEKSVRQQRQAATNPSESSPAVTRPNAKRYKVLSQYAGLSMFV